VLDLSHRVIRNSLKTETNRSLTARNPPDADRSDEQVYDDTVRLAQPAEASGFDSVWTSEHRFREDGYGPSVLPLCAALATEAVTIGTGIALGYQPGLDHGTHADAIRLFGDEVFPAFE